jgi:hypothetical protein
MYYGLAYYPDVDTKGVEQIRREYDPTVDLIAPHMGIMFPVPASIGEAALVRHLATVLTPWHSFNIRFARFEKSWDHWLLLTLLQGKDNVVRLHDQIYTGILAPHLRTDIAFVPHIALGLFVADGSRYQYLDPQQLPLDAARYSEALRKAEDLRLDLKCLVKKLHLLVFPDDFSDVTQKRSFTLSNTRAHLLR